MFLYQSIQQEIDFLLGPQNTIFCIAKEGDIFPSIENF